MCAMAWLLDLQLHVQSVPITTNVSSNLAHAEVYSIQQYVIKFVSYYLRQIDGFLRFPLQIKLTATIELKYC